LGRTAHHYLIFETAGGFCGITWNGVGITRLQLPTRSAKATERILQRRVPDAESGAPTPEVAEVVVAVKRYFEGEETDFSGFRPDLGEQDPFFERVYAAARQVGWGHTTTYGALAKELGAGPEAARDVGQAMARNPVALIIPATGSWQPAVRLVVFPRRAVRRPRSACLSWSAFTSSHRDRFSDLSRSERGAE
jgi:methylated-DNA-[protein]-cysteine S-methyltransferase